MTNEEFEVLVETKRSLEGQIQTLQMELCGLEKATYIGGVEPSVEVRINRLYFRNIPRAGGEPVLCTIKHMVERRLADEQSKLMDIYKRLQIEPPVKSGE